MGTQLLGTASLGLIWAIAAMGVYASFRKLDLIDFTVEGSFSAGGCLAFALSSQGAGHLAPAFASIIGGAACGALTFSLIRFAKLPSLFAGLASASFLSAACGWLMESPPSVFSASGSLFSDVAERTGMPKEAAALLCAGAFFALAAFALRPIFGERFSQASSGKKTLACLCSSNAAAALSGCLVAQYYGMASADMGSGSLLIALTAILLGEALYVFKVSWIGLFGAAGGSILFRFVSLALAEFGASAFLAKGAGSILFVLALAFTLRRQKKGTGDTAPSEAGSGGIGAA